MVELYLKDIPLKVVMNGSKGVLSSSNVVAAEAAFDTLTPPSSPVTPPAENAVDTVQAVIDNAVNLYLNEELLTDDADARIIAKIILEASKPLSEASAADLEVTVPTASSCQLVAIPLSAQELEAIESVPASTIGDPIFFQTGDKMIQAYSPQQQFNDDIAVVSVADNPHEEGVTVTEDVRNDVDRNYSATERSIKFLDPNQRMRFDFIQTRDALPPGLDVRTIVRFHTQRPEEEEYREFPKATHQIGDVVNALVARYFFGGHEIEAEEARLTEFDLNLMAWEKYIRAVPEEEEVRDVVTIFPETVRSFMASHDIMGRFEQP